MPPLGTYLRAHPGKCVKISQSLAHYSPKRGATQMLISLGVERQITAYWYNEIQK